jgi:hypothetical protein
MGRGVNAASDFDCQIPAKKSTGLPPLKRAEARVPTYATTKKQGVRKDALFVVRRKDLV